MDRSCSIFFLLLKVTTEWLIEDARFLDPNTTGVGGGGALQEVIQYVMVKPLVRSVRLQQVS